MTLGIEVTFGSKKEYSAFTLKQNGIQRCTTSITGSRLVANGFLRITRLTSRLIWRSFSKNFPSAENWPATKFTNDFTKIAGLECYAPTDNVSELTARTNDEGWASVFVEWLRGSRLNEKDAVMVFSVGGGNLEKNVSPNLVSALKHAKEVKASVLGIVGRDGGYTATVADVVCIVPTVNPENVTPHSEAFQAVIWHLLVSHPKLKVQQTKWESTR